MSKNSRELGKAFGYLHEQEIEAMKSIVATLPQDSVCINIGAGVGTSGLIFMEGKNVAKLYTIDIFGGGRPIGGLGNERNAMKDAGFENDKRLHQIQGDSTVVGESWNGGEVDMVFIDGDHSYEHCKSDALAWLPHIKSDGVISFHDYAKNPWIGVFTFVNEYFMKQWKKYPLITHTDTFVAFKVK